MVDKKKKGGLAKRYQASYESKGSSGGKSGVMDYKKVDGDVEFFSPKEGRNRINIIPYTIKTKNHPLVRKGEFEIGDKDYVMDIFTPHYGTDGDGSVLAGYDIRHGCIGPGTANSHGYERTHVDGLRNTWELLTAYIRK